MAIPVTIQTYRPLAEIWLRDAAGRVVSGFSPLSTEVEPGLYRIGYKTDTVWKEYWSEISDKGISMTHGKDDRPEFWVGQVLHDPSPVPEKAHALSLVTDLPRSESTESELVLITRLDEFSSDSKAPWLRGLRLCDSSGALVANLALRSEWDESLRANVCRLKAAAGSYLLRAEGPDGQVEQSIIAVAGWETRLDIVSQPPGQIPNFVVEHMFLSPSGSQVGEEDVSKSRLLFRHLTTRDLEISNLPLPAECLKMRNATLALYQAHYLLASSQLDRGLLRDLADVVRELVGNIPDVRALDLYLAGLTAEHKPFLLPPMLQSSWQLVVNHSIQDRGIVPPDSYAERACWQIVRQGIWLSWMVPPTHDPSTERGGAEAIADLQAQRHRLRRAVERKSVPVLDANELRLLQTAARVAQTEMRMRWFALGLRLPASTPDAIYQFLLKTVGRAVWLLPRDQARAEADENLSPAALVRAMNMPQSTVERIAALMLDKMAVHWSDWWPSWIRTLRAKLFPKSALRLPANARERSSSETNILLELLIGQLEASSDLLKHGYGLISIYVVINTPLLKYRFDETTGLAVRHGLSGVGLALSLAALTIVAFQNGEYQRTRNAIRRLIDLLGLPLADHIQLKQNHITIVLLIVFAIGSAGWLTLLLVNGW